MICDELVRIGAFKSKSEARNMIKNGGVSIIPCINEDYEVSCFEVDCEGGDWEAENPKCEYFEQVGDEKQYYKKGYVLSPNGTHIPAKMWEVRDCNINLLQYREKLMNDTAHNSFYSLSIKNPNKGTLYCPLKYFKDGKPTRLYPENETMVVITWDKEFGKNPWIVSDPNLEYTLKTGDTVKLGKNKTIIV